MDEVVSSILIRCCDTEESEISYDYLVMGLGIVPDIWEKPLGASSGLKTLDEATES